MKLIGKGSSAEIYENDEGNVLKLFNAGYSKNEAMKEYSASQFMEHKRLPVPACIGFTENEGRYGIEYENMKGVNFFDFLLNSADLVKAMNIFSDTHKSFINTRTDDLDSYKTVLEKLCNSDEKLVRKIRELPDGKCLCHGEFHPFNLFITEESHVMAIGFENVCKGPREFDIARTYYFLSFAHFPEGTENEDEYVAIRQSLGLLYLGMMNATPEEVEPYLYIIKKCGNAA